MSASITMTHSVSRTHGEGNSCLCYFLKLKVQATSVSIEAGAAWWVTCEREPWHGLWAKGWHSSQLRWSCLSTFSKTGPNSSMAHRIYLGFTNRKEWWGNLMEDDGLYFWKSAVKLRLQSIYIFKVLLNKTAFQWSSHRRYVKRWRHV